MWGADSLRHYTVYASIANARPIGLDNWPVEFSLLCGAPPKTAKPRQPLHALQDCIVSATPTSRRLHRRSLALGNIHYFMASYVLRDYANNVAASPAEMERRFWLTSTAATFSPL